MKLTTGLGFEITHDASTACNADEVIDIVAVHGIGATASSTWTANKINWLTSEGMLPQLIPNARMLCFGYESNWFGKSAIQQRLPLVADQLLRTLSSYRTDCPDRPLIFVGHCFGGLVIEKALITAKLLVEDFPGVLRATAGVVFLGTPHRGSGSQSKAAILASIAAAFHLGEESALIKAVEKDSDMLADLLYDFTRVCNTASIPCFCFFEQHRSDLTKIFKPKGSKLPGYWETIVDESSGCIDGFPKLGLSCDHFQINRFARPDDPNYIHVSREVAAFAKSANFRVKQRLFPSAITFGTSLINDEKDLAALRAIFITDPLDDMAQIQASRDKVLEETARWVLSNTSFTKWLNDKHSRLLWLHGDPGKGKTMLAISLVRDMSARIETEGSAEHNALASFFCDNKDERRKDAVSILRGLIYQLICQRPHTCVFLRDQYDKQREQLFSSSNALYTLWRILNSVAGDSSFDQIFFVVDALDELEPESQEQFLALINPDDVEATRHPSKIKWLVTSRNEVLIRQMLTGQLDVGLEENASSVEQAVQTFIVAKCDQLQRRKRYDKRLRGLVEDQLTRRAEGTFLWVALACKELGKPSVLSINTEAVLAKLPSGVTQLYAQIMGQVLESSDEAVVIVVKSILQAMLLALRPMTLQELAVVSGLPVEHRNEPQVLQEYVYQCGSLVTTRADRVHFVHLSAKTFLLTNQQHKILSDDQSINQKSLALNCFDFVRTWAHQSSQSGLSRESNKREDQLQYPLIHWMDHTRSSARDVVTSFDFDCDFFSEPSADRAFWFHYFWPLRHAKWQIEAQDLTKIHLFAYGGLPSLLEAAVEVSGALLEHQDSLGNTALIWAARNGHLSCVKVLLAKDVHVSTKNAEGMSAMQWAAGNGHKDIVQALFDHGASLHEKDKQEWTPLHRAAYNGHEDVVRLLLELGADIESVDGSTWTALHRSSSSGQVEIVKLLLKTGASTNAVDREGMVALLHAAWAGQHEVVDCHLNHGVHVDVVDLNGWTCLHNAAWNGHLDTITLLLERNATVDMSNSEGCTALHQATWTGKTQAVIALLTAGADVNARDEEGETALHKAAWHGHTDCLKALLGAGARVNEVNSIGHTALHHAAGAGHEHIASILIAANADPFLKDRHGMRPRGLAERSESDRMVVLLKDREYALQSPSAFATPVERPLIDSAVAEALQIDRAVTSVEPHQAAGFFVPEKISTILHGKRKLYYMKSGSNPEMFESEFLSLTLLQEASPSLAPRPTCWGRFKDSDTFYLITEWIDVEAEEDDDDAGAGSQMTLAQKVAQLHTRPAPSPQGFRQPPCGFPIKTYCGSTPQKNDYCVSWAKFYAENRLRDLCRIIEENHGTDTELTSLLDRLIDKVVYRLLGNGRLGGKQGITPVLLHGDLWEGNKAKGRFDDRPGIEHVTFDPACFYGHSEFDLALMRMFGGFTAGFFNEYHYLVPKTEPKDEYDDRMELYELYHYLNHYAIYSGGYRDDVIDSMKKLIGKYDTDTG